MEFNEVWPNATENYYLKEDAINLIYPNKGKLILPETTKLCQVCLLFIENGEYLIWSEACDLKLGNLQGKYWGINPGQLGQDTMPSFIYIPTKHSWFIYSQGNFISFTEKQAKEIYNHG